MNIDSGTTVRFGVAFKDFDKNPAAPTAVYAAVHCLSPPIEIRAETLLASPTDTMTLMVTNTENTMRSPRATETRRLTVRAVYGQGDELVTHQDYLLRKAT